MTSVSDILGIYPRQAIADLIAAGHVRADAPFEDGQLQPASLDLRLGATAYRLRASFLPGKTRTVKSCLDNTQRGLVLTQIDLTAGAVLETGCVYLVPLQEALNLPGGLSASANPKSSTGRLDVFTRVITDHGEQFDQIKDGYDGLLYVEIAPRTYPVLAKQGERLVQIRFRAGAPEFLRALTVSIDLTGFGNDGIVGYRARRHAGLVDLAGRDHAADDFWEPLRARHGMLILDPDEFYILASKEAVAIGLNEAAEMAPVALEMGEFRAHYAGFFDPGFGLDSAGGAGSRAVLEVRGRDVPFILEDGQPVAKLLFERMTDAPDILYGEGGSHYQAQGLRLSKHFV